MNYCTNCGKKLIKNSNYCDNCGYKIENVSQNNIVNNKIKQNSNVNSTSSENNNIEKVNNNSKYYVIANAVLVFSGLFLESKAYTPFALLAAFIIIITAKIKYPKATTVNVVFWIELTYLIMFMAFIVFVLVMCNSCGDSFRGCE